MTSVTRRTAGDRGFALLGWGLAFHIAVIALLYGLARVPADPLRVLAAWKEAVVVLLVLYVTVRAMLGLGPRVAVSGADMTLTALLGFAAVFLVGSHTIIDVTPKWTGQLYGFRDAAFFLALYYVGRAMPDVIDDSRTFRRLVIIGIVTSVIAMFEIAFVTPEMLVAAGVSAYFNEFLNIGETTSGNIYGLPDNYWSRTTVGGDPARRAGSTYLTSQGFAIPFLIILAIVTWRLFADDRRVTKGWVAAYVILWIGLFLSITRITTMACGLQILAALALRKRAGTLMTMFVAGIMTLTAAGIASPSIGSFIWRTLSGQTGSNTSHARDLSNGIDALLEKPWGAGLGTADQTALRNGLKPLTFDNMYLKYGDELGVLGLALLCGVLVTFLAKGRELAVHGDTPNRQWAGGVVFLATFGIFINGLTSNVFNSPWLSYMYFWLAGAVVTMAQRTVPHAAGGLSTIVPTGVPVAPVSVGVIDEASSRA